MSELYTRLDEFAHDLWWSWRSEGAPFWAELCGEALWKSTEHNPVACMAELGESIVDRMTPELLDAFEHLEAARAAYLGATDTWHDIAGRPLRRPIAYFSAEFGLHESVHIYSGGLGILAGDHVKSASDLGLNFVAVGMLYRYGYIHQTLDAKGHQGAHSSRYDFDQNPTLRVKDAQGNDLKVAVPIADRTCYCQVWSLKVGRVVLYLLDTDIPENDEDFRGITGYLYGGGSENRIRQELVLGVGGVRALRAMGIDPQVFHLNEGHASFLTLERIREVFERPSDDLQGEARHQACKAALYKAIEKLKDSSVFTTHTPVEAGHDRFEANFCWYNLQWFGRELGLTREDVLELGHWVDESDQNALFNMTLLALRTCGRANGVAALHGEVSREMFSRFWPSIPLTETPISHVTNGVHAPSWQAPNLYELLKQYMPEGFRARPPSDHETWNTISKVPDEKIWAVHKENKLRLFDLVRTRENARRERLGMQPWQDKLNPDALTIGFARRFATYKRATLLISDMRRLFSILASAKGPVQFIYAGKAHPADEPGKAFIRQIYEASMLPELEGRMILVENYDIELGRALTRGVDVWLNNPVRPKEASGTSGMKAGMNGALNLSISDGWWPEGYNGNNGWVIGEPRKYPTQAIQDAADADSLYTLLEDAVIPTYYNQDANGIPHKWIEMMKSAIASITPGFHSDRQVIDYVQHMYVPGAPWRH